jgi:hypothetical protein
MHDPIPSARTIDPSIPAAADELIAWAMAKDPADRPQTAAEFVRLLDQVLAHPNQTLDAPRSTVAPEKRKDLPALWIGVGALGVVCLATLALVGGNRVAALLFPVPTAMVRPVATDAALPTPTAMSQLMADDFSDPASGFSVGQDADGGVEYANGALRLTVLHQGIEWTPFSHRVKAQDVVVDVEAIWETQATQTEIGLICRWVDPENYVASAISDDGTFSIWARRKRELVRLVDWTAAPSLSEGSTTSRHLRLTCRGDQIQFKVDSTLLGEATDSSPAAGDIALLAGLRGTDPLVVSFDNVEVTTPGP